MLAHLRDILLVVQLLLVGPPLYSQDSEPTATPSVLNDIDTDYIGSADPRDPVLSPLYSNLSGFPPTLFITSTRDVVLSATTILHRAFLRAGVDAQLIAFEALPHAFWHNPELPESKEANKFIAEFFTRHLGR